MIFFRGRLITNFNYNIIGEILLRSMAPIKDVGNLFNVKLKFDCYINDITHRSHKTLGFINRSRADFTRYVKTIILLFSLFYL